MESPTGLPAPSVPTLASEEAHKPIKQELIEMVEHSPALRDMLTQSIEKAKAINPDKASNPAQSLSEYYDFVEWASKALPWNVVGDWPAGGLYSRIDQALDYMYFINDMSLDALSGKGYYHNSIQYEEPYRSWLIHFVRSWGAFLSTEASWCDEYCRMALKEARFGLDRGWYEDPSHWKSFNDFFSRRLCSPEQRPIAEKDDDSVVVFPADSLPQGVWRIDDDSNIVQKPGEQERIKSGVLSSVAALIGEGSAYREAFAGGLLTHTFLNVDDYHRYHFPVSGTVREVCVIPQDDASGGIMRFLADEGVYYLDAETPGWQSTETRGRVIVETDDYGLVALMPIGMSQVSSINFEENIVPGARFKKGDPLGYFLFGGSDFVMLFQKEAHFEMCAPRENNAYRHGMMGQQYGKFRPACAQAGAPRD